jgi:hypothetical protein
LPATPTCGFDYAALCGDAAQFGRDTAQKLRNWQRRTVADIIDIGTDLLKVKAAFGHGNFTQWLDAEFRNDKRTAQRFMQVAARLGDKSDTVSFLPPATVYRLASKSMPDDVVTGCHSILVSLHGPVFWAVFHRKISYALGFLRRLRPPQRPQSPSFGPACSRRRR